MTFRASGLLASILSCAVLLGCEPAQTQSGNQSNSLPLGTGFDFYVLSLSWSPGYCASTGERANKEQCGDDKNFGFIVHGLWPQFERGYPEFCDTDQPLSVSLETADTIRDIMPATGLIRHQWKKHGSCTGLSQRDYFATTRAALERISLPESLNRRSTISTISPGTVEEDFIAANEGLANQSIAVTCDRRFLRDVRICLSKDLATFVTCPEVDERACRKPGVVVPPNL